MNKTKRLFLCETWALLCAMCVIPNLLHAQQGGAIANAPAARHLTLSEAVSLALKNDREVLLAETDAASAAAGHLEARAPFHPEVFGGSGLAATKGFPLSIEGSAPSIFQVSTQQALFNPSLRYLEKQAAEIQAAAGKTLEQKRDDIVAQTVLTYLDLDRSRRSLEYVRGHAQSLAAAEQIMSERVQSGLEPPLEDTRAKLNTARSRSEAVGVENQISMLEFTLRDLTGIPQSQPIELEPVEVPGLPAEETLDQLVARATENNEGVQALEDQVRAKEFQIRSEQATRWPRVDLVAQYGLFSNINNYASYFKSFSRNNITAGVSIQVPLYNRFRASAVITKADAELAAARLRLSDAQAGIGRQVRQLWADRLQQTAAQEVARLELELARRSLDAVLEQYAEGRINNLAVEQARSQENQSWVNFLDAGYQTEKAGLELLRVSGGIRNVFH